MVTLPYLYLNKTLLFVTFKFLLLTFQKTLAERIQYPQQRLEKPSLLESTIHSPLNGVSKDALQLLGSGIKIGGYIDTK